MDEPRSMFQIHKGVKQGEPLSPNLFNALLENIHIFRNLNWENKRITIDGQNLYHLRFADDIVLVSGDRGELQEMLRRPRYWPWYTTR